MNKPDPVFKEANNLASSLGKKWTPFSKNGYPGARMAGEYCSVEVVKEKKALGETFFSSEVNIKQRCFYGGGTSAKDAILKALGEMDAFSSRMSLAVEWINQEVR